jgi:hypothetical protein
MESKKINQLATEMTPTGSDLTIIGDPITGVSRKITLIQLAGTIGAGADLQQVTDNGATTTNPIAIGGLTITGLATGVLKSDSGVISSVPFGAANGVATLGGDGKVPSNQLPSYVDDVVEVANFAALPVTGETGKLYITLDNNKVYRWTGSIYVEIAANNAVWGAITGTLSNQTDLQNALNAKQNTITLTTTGTSGASTLVGSTLNIPNYAPDLSGYVPYTGATANVNLGTFDLTADVITGATGSFASSGGSDTFAINHSSGSGIALNITKGGNGEGLYINKTSGSGNAATIIGTLNATTLVKSGGTSSQFLKADGSVDSSTYLTTSAAASTYVTLGTTQTITGDKTFDGNNVYNGVNTYNTHQTRFTAGIAINQTLSGGAVSSHTVIGANVNGLNVNFPAGGYNSLNFASTSVSNTYTFPNATGTLALTSQLTSGTVTSVGLSSATSGVTIGSSPITTSGTITLAIATASGSQNGLLSSTDWSTFNGKQDALNGTGFVKISGTTISYDNSTYLTTSAAASTYLALSGGTLTGALNGTSATFSGNMAIGSSTTALSPLQVVATGTIVRLGEQSGTTGKQFLIGIDGTAGRTELQSVWQGTGFTSLALQPSGGNVLIGTTTDNGIKLQVAGGATFSGGANFGSDVFTYANGGIFFNGGGSYGSGIFQQSGGSLALQTGTTPRLTISSTGAATFSSSEALSAKFNSADANGGYIVFERSGTPISYIGSAYHLVAPAGSNNDLSISNGVGNLVFVTGGSFLERMRITNGGNVGIGTTSPAMKLQIGDGTGTGNQFLRMFSSACDMYIGQHNSLFSLGTIQTIVTDSTYTNPFVIGTLNGSAPLVFGTNGTERMRILGSISGTSSVLIGSTSSNWDTTNRGTLEISGSGTSLLGLKVGSTPKAYFYTTGTDTYINNEVNGGALFCTAFSGGVYLSSGATSWTANSDERLKNINSEIENALEKIMTLRAVNFSWKSDETKKENLGLIAQDVQKVFPQVIDKNKLANKPNEIQTDETEYLGVRYQDLVPVLIAAIQELKAEIEQLKNK